MSHRERQAFGSSGVRGPSLAKLALIGAIVLFSIFVICTSLAHQSREDKKAVEAQKTR